MLKFFSSMLCTSSIHPFSLAHYMRTSLTIGNLMTINDNGIVGPGSQSRVCVKWPLYWHVFHCGLYYLIEVALDLGIIMIGLRHMSHIRPHSVPRIPLAGTRGTYIPNGSPSGCPGTHICPHARIIRCLFLYYG